MIYLLIYIYRTGKYEKESFYCYAKGPYIFQCRLFLLLQHHRCHSTKDIIPPLNYYGSPSLLWSWLLLIGMLYHEYWLYVKYKLALQKVESSGPRAESSKERWLIAVTPYPARLIQWLHVRYKLAFHKSFTFQDLLGSRIRVIRDH